MIKDFKKRALFSIHFRISFLTRLPFNKKNLQISHSGGKLMAKRDVSSVLKIQSALKRFAFVKDYLRMYSEIMRVPTVNKEDLWVLHNKVEFSIVTDDRRRYTVRLS